MRPPRVNTVIISATAAVLTTAALTGCSSSSGTGSPSSSAAGSSSAVASASAVAPVTQATLPAASAIVNDVAKRKAIVVSKCAATSGGWLASGTAANSGTSAATYAITIFFTNAHATVEDYATASVTVKPGQTQDWSASKQFSASTPTNCVLRGVG